MCVHFPLKEFITDPGADKFSSSLLSTFRIELQLILAAARLWLKERRVWFAAVHSSLPACQSNPQRTADTYRAILYWWTITEAYHQTYLQVSAETALPLSVKKQLIFKKRRKIYFNKMLHVFLSTGVGYIQIHQRELMRKYWNFKRINVNMLSPIIFLMSVRSQRFHIKGLTNFVLSLDVFQIRLYKSNKDRWPSPFLVLFSLPTFNDAPFSYYFFFFFPLRNRNFGYLILYITLPKKSKQMAAIPGDWLCRRPPPI